MARSCVLETIVTVVQMFSSWRAASGICVSSSFRVHLFIHLLLFFAVKWSQEPGELGFVQIPYVKMERVKRIVKAVVEQIVKQSVDSSLEEFAERSFKQMFEQTVDRIVEYMAEETSVIGVFEL